MALIVEDINVQDLINNLDDTNNYHWVDGAYQVDRPFTYKGYVVSSINHNSIYGRIVSAFTYTSYFLGRVIYHRLNDFDYIYINNNKVSLDKSNWLGAVTHDRTPFVDFDTYVGTITYDNGITDPIDPIDPPPPPDPEPTKIQTTCCLLVCCEPDVYELISTTPTEDNSVVVPVSLPLVMGNL